MCYTVNPVKSATSPSCMTLGANYFLLVSAYFE
jgi:hypothetical protein